ncbi:hypothetical protein [Streptomyces sp. NPDC060184]|uniref:hypothetical protein n=1 Tax=Streptomyces sp. NPDC060184 TaxID=3347064 RepID=UPI003658EAC1
MIGTTRAGRRTAGVVRRYTRGGPAVLGIGIALVLATAGCESSGSESTPAAPSATAPAPAGSTPAAATPTGTAGASPSSGQCPGTADETLRLSGHRIEHDIIYLATEEGGWDCSQAATPRWKGTGAKRDIRIAETAEITVGRPFTSSAAHQPIELSRFLEQIDTLARNSADPLVFSYSTDPASGLLVQLTQEQAPGPTG